MRRLIAAALLCSCAWWNVPAGAASRGAIRGRVTNESTGAPQPGVEITLVRLSLDAEEDPSVTRTDADGRFEFAGLATGEEVAYALDALHDGGLFASAPIRLPGDTRDPPVIDVRIRVWDTVADPTVISLRRNDFFVIPDEEGGVGVIEALVVHNDSDRAYIGRGGEGSPSLGIALPQDARAEGISIADASLEVPELVPTDFGAGITVALPPGETRLTVAWRVPGETGQFDLARTALYRTEELNVYAGEPLEIRSTRLERTGSETIDDRTYRVWSSRETIDAGDPVQVLAVADPGISSGLVIGLATGLGIMGLLVVAALLARKRGRTQRPDERPADEDLLVAIARLDLEYETGELTEESWSAERDRLKSLLRSRESTR